MNIMNLSSSPQSLRRLVSWLRSHLVIHSLRSLFIHPAPVTVLSTNTVQRCSRRRRAEGLLCARHTPPHRPSLPLLPRPLLLTSRTTVSCTPVPPSHSARLSVSLPIQTIPAYSACLPAKLPHQPPSRLPGYLSVCLSVCPLPRGRQQPTADRGRSVAEKSAPTEANLSGSVALRLGNSGGSWLAAPPRAHCATLKQGLQQPTVPVFHWRVAPGARLLRVGSITSQNTAPASTETAPSTGLQVWSSDLAQTPEQTGRERSRAGAAAEEPAGRVLVCGASWGGVCETRGGFVRGEPGFGIGCGRLCTERERLQ